MDRAVSVGVDELPPPLCSPQLTFIFQGETGERLQKWGSEETLWFC